MCKWLLIPLVCLLVGCAAPPEDRYLSKEEDANLREKCEPSGCVVVPAPIWQKLLNMLRQRTA